MKGITDTRGVVVVFVLRLREAAFRDSVGGADEIRADLFAGEDVRFSRARSASMGARGLES